MNKPTLNLNGDPIHPLIQAMIDAEIDYEFLEEGIIANKEETFGDDEVYDPWFDLDLGGEAGDA